MLKILKNLKQSWISVLIIVLLLCLQAAVDLELPNYTSKIVNEGIQSGGIEDAVPNEISNDDMEAVLLFTEADDKIIANYSIENEKYILKDKTVQPVVITKGLSDVSNVEILDGLKVGDEIIIEQVSNFKGKGSKKK